MIPILVFCLAGFLLLWMAADWLVQGSASLARKLGVPPIVIGLTVVAFGTSAPELVVSLISSLEGKSMIAVGNVVGSNICNIALVLGLAAACRPISCHPSVCRRDLPVMILISVGVILLWTDSSLSRVDGGILLAGIVLYTLMNYLFSRKAGEHPPLVEEVEYTGSIPFQIWLVVTGIAGVMLGARMVVETAVALMSYLGVSEKFVGLTVVAFGTSLPELATSVVAAIRREMDISIGNLVGSNVFNLLSVLGVAAVFNPIILEEGFFESGLAVDYAVMLAVSLLPLLMLRKSGMVSRKNGITLLLVYVGYVGYLVYFS